MNITLSISVVIATYNSERTIDRTLKSIREQLYPQPKVEIIIADGGSRDQTETIARRYKVKFISVDPRKQNAEYNKSIGLSQARHQIVAFIDHDNVLPHKHWFRKMTRPFLEHPHVSGVESLRYHYDPRTSLLDRYFALFGAGDPIVWYLGKADRLSYLYDQFNLLGKAIDCGDYYLVKFDKDQVPTIGANGFLVRRRFLVDHAQVAPGKYFDMDVNIDLISQGFNTYAFVKDTVLHLTGYGSIWYFLKRRMLFVESYHLSEKGLAVKKKRRYHVFEKRDLFRLIWIIFISLTFVIPFYDSLRGFRKVRDSAWFLHPFLCFSFVVIYGWVIMKHYLVIYGKKLLVR